MLNRAIHASEYVGTPMRKMVCAFTHGQICVLSVMMMMMMMVVVVVVVMV